MAFAEVEKMIQGNFLPRLLLGTTKTLSPIVGALSKMPIRTVIIRLLNIVTSAKEKYLKSQRVSAELIWPVMGGGVFSNTNHIGKLGKKGTMGRKTGKL